MGAVLKPTHFAIGSLIALATEGDLDIYNSLRPPLHLSKDVYDDGAVGWKYAEDPY